MYLNKQLIENIRTIVTDRDDNYCSKRKYIYIIFSLAVLVEVSKNSTSHKVKVDVSGFDRMDVSAVMNWLEADKLKSYWDTDNSNSIVIEF